MYPGSIPGVASSLRKRSKVRRAVSRLLRLAGQPGKISAATRMGRRFVLSKRDRLCYMRRAHASRLFPGSSAVEQPAVNRLVAGSNPARGANSFKISNIYRYLQIEGQHTHVSTHFPTAESLPVQFGENALGGNNPKAPRLNVRLAGALSH